jgi:hypothetical protein
VRRRDIRHPHGIRAHEEAQPAQNLAGQRYQECAQEGSVLWSEPHSGVRAELPFKNGDLMAQGKDFDVFVSISHRQHAHRGEDIRDGQIGQAKDHK